VGAVPHLLAVEPELRRATALAQALAARGASATFLSDGLSLLRELGECWPSAVVLGARMPWLDPVSLCEVLRGHPEGATVPVIVLGDPGLPHARRLLGRLGALWLEGAEAEPTSVARLLVPEPLRLPVEPPRDSAHGA
jgi:DNA-binding response OmpR family regulator